MLSQSTIAHRNTEKGLSLNIQIAASDLAAHKRTAKPSYGSQSTQFSERRFRVERGDPECYHPYELEWCTQERAYLDKLEALHAAHHVALVALRDHLAPPCDLG